MSFIAHATRLRWLWQDIFDGSGSCMTLLGIVSDIEVQVEGIDLQWVLADQERYRALGPGVLVPRVFFGRTQIDAHVVRVRIEALADHVVHATEVCVMAADRAWPVDVTGEVLRKVPVASVVASAVRQAVFVRDRNGNVAMGLHSGLDSIPADVRKEWPDGDLDAFLPWVALIYRIARAVGLGPTAQVARSGGVSRATAGRQVSLARDKGYLTDLEVPRRVDIVELSPRALASMGFQLERDSSLSLGSDLRKAEADGE